MVEIMWLNDVKCCKMLQDASRCLKLGTSWDPDQCGHVCNGSSKSEEPFQDLLLRSKQTRQCEHVERAEERSCSENNDSCSETRAGR